LIQNIKLKGRVGTNMKKSRNVFLIGPMGVGKSTIGRLLADLLKLEFYDTDQEITERCGASIDWIFDIEGEQGFRERERKIIHELTDLSGIVLATGGGSVILPANRERLAARGTVVYLKASINQQMERTAKDKTRPLLQVEDRLGRLEELAEERDPLYSNLAEIIVETGDGSVRTIASEIVRQLESF
jgi:shikimate kinase